MTASTIKLGLALSGGGFRASLYHLGLLRFLRDANLLRQVSHITSVSGGSIVAAHLLLNWERYNGSANDFDTAASELLAFVRLDVRNRITRRFPLNIPLRWPRRFLGLSNRKLTRTGLLERHYEKYLYGDTSLFELPDKPQLHILATNLSEGCLCSFSRNGLLMVRRQQGNGIRLDRIRTGLATVAMAVTASSAFPGFFPPLELTGNDVGASVGDFGRQAYTDGGVFDNLGVRMFRCLQRPLLMESPLCQEDFVDFPAVVEALVQAGRSSQETPLRRLAQIMATAISRPEQALLPTSSGNGAAPHPPLEAALSPLPELDPGKSATLFTSVLWDVLQHYQLHREPLFCGLKLAEPEAEVLQHACRPGGRVPHDGDQLWLNRYLLEAAYRQATGQPCFRRLHNGLDGVLVSDVGKRIQVRGAGHAGGVIRTAMRATDILMDRVWQLENETFHDAPGFVFAPITEVVLPEQDPTALHPEIQRQLANIRTDLDRFSPLEISSLVRHGYCVGRQVCRANPEVFGTALPDGAPWDPVPAPQGAAPKLSAGKGLDGRSPEPTPVTAEARTLRTSAVRRIWSSLLDRRDWASYIYVPIIVPLLFLLPWVIVKSYQRSQRLNQLIESLSQGSRDLELMTRLLDGPIKPWVGDTPEEPPAGEPPDLKGFEILQDSRILDLRQWKQTASGEPDPSSIVYGYRRMKVYKPLKFEGNSVFRVHMLSTSPKTQTRFPRQQFKPQLFLSTPKNKGDHEHSRLWEMNVDLQKLPAGDTADLIYEHVSPGEFLQVGETSTTIAFSMQVDTAEVTRWILMPEGKEYRSFRLVRYETGKPDKVEPVKLATEYLSDDSTIIAYKLLSVKAGYTYDLTWYYK